jgi:hypothetical protein
MNKVTKKQWDKATSKHALLITGYVINSKETFDSGKLVGYMEVKEGKEQYYIKNKYLG